MEDKKEYPRYFKVSDDVVRLEQQGENIKGFVMSSETPYPPAKAIVDGYEITKEEAEKLVA